MAGWGGLTVWDGLGRVVKGKERKGVMYTLERKLTHQP